MTYAWYDRNKGTNVVSNSVNFLKREMTTNDIRLVNLLHFFNFAESMVKRSEKFFGTL